MRNIFLSLAFLCFLGAPVILAIPSLDPGLDLLQGNGTGLGSLMCAANNSEGGMGLGLNKKPCDVKLCMAKTLLQILKDLNDQELHDFLTMPFEVKKQVMTDILNTCEMDKSRSGDEMCEAELKKTMEEALEARGECPAKEVKVYRAKNPYPFTLDFPNLLKGNGTGLGNLICAANNSEGGMGLGLNKKPCDVKLCMAMTILDDLTMLTEDELKDFLSQPFEDKKVYMTGVLLYCETPLAKRADDCEQNLANTMEAALKVRGDCPSM